MKKMCQNCCETINTHEHSHAHGHEHSHAYSHEHSHEPGVHSGGLRAFAAPIVSLIMLVAGMLMSHFRFEPFVASRWIEFAWYLIAFLPVGLPVMREAGKGILHGDIFNEFTLMVIACIGAFCIWELPEAVGVMLFYSIGETLQDMAVGSATRNISKLLDVRAERAHLVGDLGVEDVDPKSVAVGATIEVRPGERVPLDGVLESGVGVFDTSALTGESVPRDVEKGQEVLAGMISMETSVRLKVTKEYGNSALARILEMVKNASTRKAHTEQFIRKFARIYTPVVIALAVLVVAIPALVSLFTPTFHYVFSEWLYRALVFLVISCPCALVVSVPLGYFAGVGAASRMGILFKGGNYLEAITKINNVAFDKTGTLTVGHFSIERVEGSDLMLSLLAAAEAGSSHPLAKAVVAFAKEKGLDVPMTEKMSERPGRGTIAEVNGRRVLAGNIKLLREENVDYPAELEAMTDTIIVCAIDGTFAGFVTLADRLKPDAEETVRELRKLGVDKIVMLSGDKKEIVRKYADKLGISEAYGELMPQDKARYVEEIANTPGRNIAFVGDGMNDAPVLALSDVGVAMGGLGSDAAIESADVVIQTDHPSRLATAIRIGRTTHTIVTENIIGAIGIKVLILALGALGYASLWAAVFADVGVALLAILNSMRILWKHY